MPLLLPRASLSCHVSFSRKPSLTHRPSQAFPLSFSRPGTSKTTGLITLGCHPTWTLSSLRAGPRAVSSRLCLQHRAGESKNSKQLQNH